MSDREMAAEQIVTYRFRLKDKHASVLNRMASAVNFVWNFCNETQQIAVRRDRFWPTAYDLGRLAAGSSKLLGLHAQSIEAVCHQYAKSRKQHRRRWLRFRSYKSLGWVPFKKGNIRVKGATLVFNGRVYEPMHWRGLPEGAVICAGSFSRDARGRWYINCPVAVPAQETAKTSSVGIDLGLKDLATLSTGQKIENPRHFARLQEKLSVAQCARKKRLAAKTAARIKNSRRDFLHKLSTQIAKNHDVIVVGNVSSSKLSQTRMAKSVLDAGWHTFKTMLAYKAIRHGGRYVEVDEAWTTRACSCCGVIPDSSPKGIGALGIREWTCDCGAVHDRDVNAARNILRLGQQSLAGGAAQMRSCQLHKEGV